MTLSSREDELEQSQQTAGFPASGGASLPSRLTAKRALSEFTLIPATDVSKCCSAAAMFGAGASAAGAEGRVIEIPLFRGANCEGKSAASGGGGATCRAVNQLGFSSLGIPGDAKVRQFDWCNCTHRRLNDYHVEHLKPIFTNVHPVARELGRATFSIVYANTDRRCLTSTLLHSLSISVFGRAVSFCAEDCSSLEYLRGEPQ